MGAGQRVIAFGERDISWVEWGTLLVLGNKFILEIDEISTCAASQEPRSIVVMIRSRIRDGDTKDTRELLCPYLVGSNHNKSCSSRCE
jgi:hypothetical protein